MKSIGKIIREERINKKLTQKDLAMKMGLTQDSISLWEKDKRLPDTQYIVMLCKILEISSDYLLGIEE